MSWIVPQDGASSSPARPTQWVVRYTRPSGEVSTNVHQSRESARDALVDRLLESALTLWAIGARSASPAKQNYFDRGDRFIHHVVRLMDTTEDGYIIAGAGGRKWVLCEIPTAPQPSPAT